MKKTVTSRQSIKMITMLCLIYVASCKTTDNQTTTSPPPSTKEDFIGSTYKSDLKLIDRAMADVESLRYQLPRHKGKDLNQLSYEEVEETLFNRLAQDKGEDIKAVYYALREEPIYKELRLAQAKSLRIMGEKTASARAITEYDLAAILSPFEELLNQTDVSEKYVNYSKALKEAITGTLSSHIQDMEKAKEVVDGEEVIKNYDKSAFQNAAQGKISAIENEILADSGLTDGEKTILLQTSTLAYEKTALISSILNEDTSEGGRVQWSWRKFWKVVKVVVAVVVVAAVSAYVAPYIAIPVFKALGAKTAIANSAITFSQIGGSILKLGAISSNLAITGAGVTTAVASGFAGQYVASEYYCGATRCNRCSSYSLMSTIASCY